MNSKKLIFLIVLIFLFSNISATIVANSSSYSVGMFGTGMATDTITSTNYNATFLSESAGTTDGASSNSYTANIGFFDSPYSRTVSISSYSISPASAVVESTISLSISALNAEAVWAIVTAPNSQTQRIDLINDNTVSFLPSPSIVGTYTVTFYANSSTGAIASAIDYFILTDSTVTPPSGGGTTTIECSYIWECSAWSICIDGIQTRTCENKGDCNGKEGKPAEERNCSDALFDVLLSFENLVITENKTLKFNVHLIEQQGIEKIDVQVMYSIIDKEGKEIFNQIETRSIQGELKFEKELKEAVLKDGKYTLRVDILYGDMQRAFAEQEFEVQKDGIKITPPRKSIDWKVVEFMALLLLLILIICLLAKRRKKREYGRKSHFKYKKKIKKHLNKIRSYNFLIVALCTVAVAFLFAGRQTLTSFATGIQNIEHLGWFSLGFIFIIGILVLLVVHREKIKVRVEETKEKIIQKEYPKESVKGLINRKVYTEKGDIVGKVKEVMLGENRIIELLIEFNKKVKKKNKIKLAGGTMKYREIGSVGHVVIVKDKIWDHILKSKNIKAEKNLKNKERENDKEKS